MSDPNNNRILGFADAREVGPGVPADLVIGEPDLMTALCNFGGVTNPATKRFPASPRNPAFVILPDWRSIRRAGTYT